jgi:hypothetical protein
VMLVGSGVDLRAAPLRLERRGDIHEGAILGGKGTIG